jgi:hypothetical protein
MLEILLVTVYAALALTIFGGRGMLAVLALVAYLVVYDYAFLNLEAALGRPVIAAKTFSEVLLVAAAVTVFAIQIRRRSWRRLDFVVIGALAVVTVTGLVGARAEVVAALEDYRVLMAPLVLAALLSLAVQAQPHDARNLRRTLLALGVATILLASYQYLTFDGDLEAVWRHDFLLALNLKQDPDYPIRMLQYQIVRDGALRASSVFISAIDFSIFAASIGVLAFVNLVVRRRWSSGLLTALAVVGVLVSQVRIGFIVLGMGAFLTLAFGSRSRLVRTAALLSPLLAIAAIFAYIVLGGGLNDPSTLGRLPQYTYLLREFSATGSGFGSYRGRFDSYFIYAGLTLGAGVLLLALAIAWIGARLERVDRLLTVARAHPEHRVLARFALVQLLASVVVFSVHHTAGSVSYFLVFLLAMLASRLAPPTHAPRDATSRPPVPPPEVA